jgi:hypothetical protein
MRRARRRAVDSTGILGVLVAATLIVVSPAAAQTPSSPDADSATARPLGPTPTRIEFTRAIECYSLSPTNTNGAVRSVDDLVEEYLNGRLWPQLQADLTAILSTCKGAEQLAQILPGESRSRRFVVTFIGSNRQPYYVVVPQKQPYSMTLLGVTAVNAVILVDSAMSSGRAPSDFMFMSTPIQNPLEARIPAVVMQSLPSAASRPSPEPVTRSQAPPTSAAPPATMYAHVAAGILLPFSRASILEAGTIAVRDPATGAVSVVKIATTYANTPKVRFEFNFVAGAVVGEMHGAQPMKVDAGRYASDPLARALTMATLAWHPRPFDSSLSKMGQAERWSILVGGVLTPAAGVGVGLSCGIIRGFAVNTGVVGLWARSAPPGSAIGSEVVTDSDQHQLQNRFTAALFVGGSYVFRQSF